VSGTRAGAPLCKRKAKERRAAVPSGAFYWESRFFFHGFLPLTDTGDVRIAVLFYGGMYTTHPTS